MKYEKKVRKKAGKIREEGKRREAGKIREERTLYLKAECILLPISLAMLGSLLFVRFSRAPNLLSSP